MKLSLIMFLALQFMPLHGATILDAKSRGIACDNGNTSQFISFDKKSITLSYSELFAEVEEDRERDQANCIISFLVDIPQRKFIDSFKIKHRGFLSTDGETNVKIQSQIRLENDEQPKQTLLNKKTKSSLDEDFSLETVLDFASKKDLLCEFDNPFRIDLHTILTLERISGPGGFLNVDGTDATFFDNIELVYFRCKRPVYRGQCSVKRGIQRPRDKKPRFKTTNTRAQSSDPRVATKKAYDRAEKLCNRLRHEWPYPQKQCKIGCLPAEKL